MTTPTPSMVEIEKAIRELERKVGLYCYSHPGPERTSSNDNRNHARDSLLDIIRPLVASAETRSAILKQAEDAVFKAMNRNFHSDARDAATRAIRVLIATTPPQAADVGPGGWHDITSAPKDRWIWVYAPGAGYDLSDIVCLCQWHEDGGFCVDELRHPTMWREVIKPSAPRPSSTRDGEVS